MSSMFRVQILAVADVAVDLEVRRAHPDACPFSEAPSFLFGFLLDTAFRISPAGAWEPAGPLGERVTVAAWGDMDQHIRLTPKFIRSVHLFQSANLPMDPAGWSRRRAIERGADPAAPDFEVDRQDAEVDYPDAADGAPWARYRVEVTDPRWIEHLSLGQRFDSANYAVERSLVSLNRDELPDLADPTVEWRPSVPCLGAPTCVAQVQSVQGDTVELWLAKPMSLSRWDGRHVDRALVLSVLFGLRAATAAGRVEAARQHVVSLERLASSEGTEDWLDEAARRGWPASRLTIGPRELLRVTVAGLSTAHLHAGQLLPSHASVAGPNLLNAALPLSQATAARKAHYVHPAGSLAPEGPLARLVALAERLKEHPRWHLLRAYHAPPKRGEAPSFPYDWPQELIRLGAMMPAVCLAYLDKTARGFSPGKARFKQSVLATDPLPMVGGAPTLPRGCELWFRPHKVIVVDGVRYSALDHLPNVEGVSPTERRVAWVSVTPAPQVRLGDATGPRHEGEDTPLSVYLDRVVAQIEADLA